MKSFRRGTLSILFALCVFSCFGQLHAPVTEPDYNKPRLFDALPLSLNIKTEVFSNLLSVPEGQAVTISLGTHTYNGIVVSKSDAADREVQSVIIRSTNFTGSALTFTKSLSRTGAIYFKGRILSRDHSDAYELQSEHGQYFFIKKHQLRIMNE